MASEESGMSPLKVYTGSGPYQGIIELPARWMGAEGSPWAYGYVCVVAETKDRMAQMLKARRLSSSAAAGVVRSVQVAKGVERPTLADLVAAGVILTDQRGVYVWEGREDGVTVYRVDAGLHEYVPVGRFEGGGGAVVRRVTEEGA